MKKVLIVSEGQWGNIKPEDYRIEANILRLLLEKEAMVEVVETAEEAEIRMGTDLIHSVVFLSRAMEFKAEALAAFYPRTRVIVFTGLIPNGKVIWATKPWAFDIEVAQNIILCS